MEGFTDTPIAALEKFELPLRVINALEELGIIYVEDLRGVRPDYLKTCVGNFGDRSVEQLKESLRALYEDTK